MMAISDSEAAPVIAKTVKQTAKDVTTLVDVFGVNTANLSDVGRLRPRNSEQRLFALHRLLRSKHSIKIQSWAILIPKLLKECSKMFSTVLWHSNEARTCLCIVNFVPMKPSDTTSPTLSVPQ